MECGKQGFSSERERLLHQTTHDLPDRKPWQWSTNHHRAPKIDSAQKVPGMEKILTIGRRVSLDLACAGPEKCTSREDVNMMYLESGDPGVSRA